jgi:peptidyl-prolyl cis-trans isomerase D
MGTVKPDDLPEPLAEAAFATPEGTVTEPVKTALGWHLAKVETVKQAQTRAFADVRDELRAELAEDKAADRLIRMANEMRDTLAGGATLEEVAQQFGLETTTVDSVDRRGRDRSGEPVEDIPAKSRVLELAFDTAVKQRSLLKETEGGGYVAVRVDEETPSKPRPFEAVRDQARRQLVQQRRLKAAREAADDVVARVENGASLQTVADARGARVETTEPLTRASTPRTNALLAALAQRVFEVDPKTAFSVEGDGRLAVATVRETRPAEPGDNPDAVSKLGGQLGRQLRNDVFRQFTNALRARHTVRVNQDAIDRIVGGAR